MGAVLVFESPGVVAIAHEPERALGDHEVRVRTLFSGISAGTELTAYRGTNPYLHKRWDDQQRLFVPGEAQFPYPLIGWGYEEVGEVIETGTAATDIALGQRVYGAWGHRETAVISADHARTHALTAGVEPILGIFARIGAIALNGILDAQINLGETVAVFGLGVVGQIVAQLARLSGADVIGIDLRESRLDLARQSGIATVLNAAEGGVAETIKQMTHGRGADVCIEATGSTAALHEAVRSCAYGSRVVALGFFQGEARGLRLGEEFHHNRIAIVCSQISGVAPSLTHRWDRGRLETTCMRLIAEDRVQLRPLITHVAPLERAGELFATLDTEPDAVMQAVIAFEGNGET
jgi:2-desacetyl-2-hydroxyethyl bacteriochlorophyllide A dehydrogenase